MRDVPKSAVRRTLLQRAILSLGGLVGLGAAGRKAGRLSPAQLPNDSVRLKIYGQNWHLRSQARRTGELAASGDRFFSYGELLDKPNGKKMGEFYATAVCMLAPFGASSVSASSVECHTFNLEDGSLVGIGASRASGTGDSVYAIVGGTGRYAAARGSYVARQRPAELGGDGTAEFSLTLTS